MNHELRKAERIEDDKWSAPKLLVVGVATLTMALSIIYFFASRAAPY